MSPRALQISTEIGDLGLLAVDVPTSGHSEVLLAGGVAAPHEGASAKDCDKEVKDRRLWFSSTCLSQLPSELPTPPFFRL